MPRRRTAKRPRNTEKPAAEVDIGAGFAELFPGLDLKALLEDPTNREMTRELDAVIIKKFLVHAAVMTFKSGKGGDVSNYWMAKAQGLAKLDAEITGNLGERVVEVPENPAARAAQLLGIDEAQFLKLFVALPELAAREEKVIEGKAVDVGPGRAQKTIG